MERELGFSDCHDERATSAFWVSSPSLANSAFSRRKESAAREMGGKRQATKTRNVGEERNTRGEREQAEQAGQPASKTRYQRLKRIVRPRFALASLSLRSRFALAAPSLCARSTPPSTVVHTMRVAHLHILRDNLRLVLEHKRFRHLCFEGRPGRGEVDGHGRGGGGAVGGGVFSEVHGTLHQLVCVVLVAFKTAM